MQQLIAPSSTITKATHTTATGVVVEYYNIMFSLSNMSAGSDVTANLLAAVAVCGCCFWLALRSSAFWPLLVLAAGCCNTQWLVCRWLETSIFNLLMPYVKWLLKFTAKKFFDDAFAGLAVFACNPQACRILHVPSLVAAHLYLSIHAGLSVSF